MNKMRFHTPGKDGKTKCRKIHVEKKNEFCPTMLVHGAQMPAVSSDNKMKETKNESKLKDMDYEQLKTQEYFTKLDVHLAKTVFRFRVRKEKFSGNYKGPGTP